MRITKEGMITTSILYFILWWIIFEKKCNDQIFWQLQRYCYENYGMGNNFIKAPCYLYYLLNVSSVEISLFVCGVPHRKSSVEVHDIVWLTIYSAVMFVAINFCTQSKKYHKTINEHLFSPKSHRNINEHFFSPRFWPDLDLKGGY